MLLWRVQKKIFSPALLARSLGEETSRVKPHISLKKKSFMFLRFLFFGGVFAAHFISFTFSLLFIY